MFAATRDPAFVATVAPDDAAIVAWRNSQRALAQVSAAVQQAIEADAELAGAVLTVAASGSLGRMELASHSDCDLLVVLKNHADMDFRKRVVTQIWRRLAPLGWRAPKQHGIYAVAAVRAELVERATLGKLDESRLTFGQRIQILLDCQPIYNAVEFSNLQKELVQRYAAARCPGYLQNELIAYYRWLLNWHAHRDADDPVKWRLRQVKLGHSRVVMYAGLLLQAMQWEANRDGNALLQKLQLTPLERVLDVASAGRQKQILQKYNFYLQSLEAGAADGCQRQFEALVENSTGLRADLFAIAMQNNLEGRLVTSLM